MIKYITINDLMETFQVSKSTIYNLMSRGLPYIKVGGSLRFNQDDVQAWVDEQNNLEQKKRA